MKRPAFASRKAPSLENSNNSRSPANSSTPFNIMKFCLKIGSLEKHLVEFSFNQLLGELSIKVDSKEVTRSRWFFNEPLSETYTLAIGQHENLALRIEKERKPLFGNKCRVFLNERLMKVQEGV